MDKPHLKQGNGVFSNSCRLKPTCKRLRIRVAEPAGPSRSLMVGVPSKGRVDFTNKTVWVRLKKEKPGLNQIV